MYHNHVLIYYVITGTVEECQPVSKTRHILNHMNLYVNRSYAHLYVPTHLLAISQASICLQIINAYLFFSNRVLLMMYTFVKYIHLAFQNQYELNFPKSVPFHSNLWQHFLNATLRGNQLIDTNINNMSDIYFGRDLDIDQWFACKDLFVYSFLYYIMQDYQQQKLQLLSIIVKLYMYQQGLAVYEFIISNWGESVRVQLILLC
eukprot:TRINITY_DN5858_c0_g1_i1.p4 TRINITY_DN5858_c0_g1~~TRINITY_DN5858_c0_g1_i1.p4  ORF type:complete len:204 (-),score=-4.07 TRINITY_DN5858_c0_g1_i1:1476-2087(-)